MLLFYGLSSLVIIPLGIYLYVIFNRLLGLFLSDRLRWLRRLLAIVLAVALALPARNLFGLWAMVVLHFAAASALVDLVRWGFKKAGHPLKRPWDILCRSGAAALIITGLILGYAYLNMGHVIMTEYTISTQKAIRPEGYTVAFLSDLHFDTTMDEAQLLLHCETIARQEPDLVVLGGDIVDEAATLAQVQTAFRALGNIPSALGTYYVYGNHDKGRYSAACDFTEAELFRAVREGGVTLLEDETVQLTPDLSLSGRRDRSDAAMSGILRTPAQKLIEDASPESYHILLDHQPREMEENTAAGFDLMLSGHTHAGQIFPVGLITTLFDHDTFNYGQKTYGSMDLVVSSGIAGWGYPFRTGKHSEFVVLHLTGPA